MSYGPEWRWPSTKNVRAEVCALDVSGDAFGPEARVEIAGEALHVQAKSPRVADESEVSSAA